MFIKRNLEQIKKFEELALAELMDVIGFDESFELPNFELDDDNGSSQSQMLRSVLLQKYEKSATDEKEINNSFDELNENLKIILWTYKEHTAPLQLEFVNQRLSICNNDNISIKQLLVLANKFNASLYDTWGKEVPFETIEKKSIWRFLRF